MQLTRGFNHNKSTPDIIYLPLYKMVTISQTIILDASSSEKFRILIKISLKFVPKGTIFYDTALV